MSLIGTQNPAPLQTWMATNSWRSWDYARCQAYPSHAFGSQQWPLDKGPRPTELPYAAILVSEGAEFLFRGGNPLFSAPDNEAADRFLQRVIVANNLSARWISLAETAGHQGAIAVKWSVDLDDPRRPVRFSFLSIPQEARVWADPHDASRVVMARVQYPYRGADGNWYYHREEWTEDLWVRYRPRFAGAASFANAEQLPGYATHLGDLGDGPDWEIESAEANPFGLIPISVIRNRAVPGSPVGEGDVWHAWHLIDRLALTMHGEDRHNQMLSEPTLVTKNARVDSDAPLMPGEPLSLTQNDPDGPPADVDFFEPSGQARQWTHADIDKWEALLYKRVGLSRVNEAEVSNKGNMTRLALTMTYARSIATSERKRELWGRSGMAVALANMLVGLKRLGGVKEVAGVPDDLVVSVEWGDYFAPTDDDIAAVTTRTISQVDAGFLPVERAAERVARAEGVPSNEIKALLTEVQALKAEREAKEQQMMEAKNAQNAAPEAVS